MFERSRVQISIEEYPPPPKCSLGGGQLWHSVSRPPVLILAAIQQSLTVLPQEQTAQ